MTRSLSKSDGVLEMLTKSMPTLPSGTTVGEYQYNPMLSLFVDPLQQYGCDLNILHPGDHQLDFDFAVSESPTLRKNVHVAGRKLVARVRSHRLNNLARVQVDSLTHKKEINL